MASQKDGAAVILASLRHPGARSLLPALPLSQHFVRRVVLVAIFVVITHQLGWHWLRFLTSEAILRMSAELGMVTTRVSFDTISVQGQLFSFVVACTFVDVFIGAIPLLWNLNSSIRRNLFRLVVAATILITFNLVRLETAQILYARGVVWTLADGVLGGFSYFAVWLVIWRVRSWEILTRAEMSHC